MAKRGSSRTRRGTRCGGEQLSLWAEAFDVLAPRATEGRALMMRLRRDAFRIARRFGLPLKKVLAEPSGVVARYGSCTRDGTVRVRLRHARTGRPLRYSSLIDTVCHELAHLRFFDHGIHFQWLYRRILEWARSEGIYEPGPANHRELRSAVRSAARVEDAYQQTLFGR